MLNYSGLDTDSRKRHKAGRQNPRLKTRTPLSGQAGLMEYLVMTIMILFVVTMGFFFLFGFESARLGDMKSRESLQFSLSAASLLSRSDALAKRDLVLDDSKLTGAVGDCALVEAVLGSRACVSVEKALFSGEIKTECRLSTYPKCNSWTLCKEACQGKTAGIALPVNIYRRFESRTDLGTISVRVRN